jgi:calcineurin-like phosphoesterase family protein
MNEEAKEIIEKLKTKRKGMPNMQNVYFISDLHFFHNNIIKYENRPFCSVEEMNREIIKRWNNTVSKSDRVFVLGDISFSSFAETEQVVRSLNGIKHLIMGNHDRGRSVAWWLNIGFDKVSEYPIIYRDFLILSHEPMHMNESMPYVNLHGHIHSQLLEGRKHINMCVEHWDYTPVHIDTITKLVTGNK